MSMPRTLHPSRRGRQEKKVDRRRTGGYYHPDMAKTQTLGERIRAAREEAGLTLRAVAHEADLTERTLWAIEADEREPNMGTLKRVCAALGITVGYAVGEE